MKMEREDRELCSKCGAAFSATASRAHPNIFAEILTIKWPSTRITESALVSCPSCGHRFPSNQVRFFGFLSLRQIRLVLLFYIAALVAVALYFALRSLWGA